MDAANRLAVIILATAVAACAPSTPAERHAGEPVTAANGSAPVHPTAPATDSSSPLTDLAGALGLARSAGVSADGLIAGGDCPTPAEDVSAEIEAQAKAAIPLKVGLTLSYSWMRTPQEEYECLIQITKIEAA